MKVKASKLLLVFGTLAQAINTRRDEQIRLPTKASYRIGRLASQLEPEYTRLNNFQLELLKKHGGVNILTPVLDKDGKPELDAEGKPKTQLTQNWAIPVAQIDDIKAFEDEWKMIADDELEVACQAIPLSCLGDGDSFFSIAEIITLGEFIVDDR